MKLIPLTHGQVAIVDADDFEFLNQWNWFAVWDESIKSYYAVRSSRWPAQHRTHMHRAVMGLVCQIDHINHNTLDNRKQNLRPTDDARNQWNSGVSRRNTSGYKGVDRCGEKWRARINHRGKRIVLGKFDSAYAAAIAYAQKAMELYPEYAHQELVALAQSDQLL